MKQATRKQSRAPAAIVAVVAIAAIAAVSIVFASCGSPAPRKIADRNGMTFGLAVKAGDIYTPETVKIMKSHFNLIVPEDSMKWVNIRPKKDFWNWADMDAMVEFAEKNGMKIKGHTFLWQDQNGPYVHSLKTREEAVELLTDHITTIMTRYKGRVVEYDVANEIFNEDGPRRATRWRRRRGDDFRDIACPAARAADPDAKLILCDYNTEYAGTAKGDASYELVKELKGRGVPVDGVAFQLHCMAELPFNEAALRENVRRFHAMGVTCSFSEVDVRIKLPADEVTIALQNDVYERLATIARTEPGAKSLILWGLSDKGSWIPRAFPGFGSANVFDKDMKKKPAYHALMKGLSGK